MANLQLPLNQEYEAVLGSEYCSGYMDALGKWNTGFYCPSSDETIDVFCCGSSFHKYCCTNRDQVLQTEVENLTVCVGILVGATTALLLIMMVSCFCCSCCPLYKKHNPTTSKYRHRGSLYRLHNQRSTTSGLTNMYSSNGASGNMYSSNGASRSLSPLSPPHGRNGRGTREESDHLQLINHPIHHSHTLPHNLSHHQSFQQTREESEDSSGRRYGTLGHLPKEQPPSYHILPRASYLVLPQEPPDLLNGSRMHQEVGIHSISGNVQMGEFTDTTTDQEEEDLYYSTKF